MDKCMAENKGRIQKNSVLATRMKILLSIRVLECHAKRIEPSSNGQTSFKKHSVENAKKRDIIRATCVI